MSRKLFLISKINLFFITLCLVLFYEINWFGMLHQIMDALRKLGKQWWHLEFLNTGAKVPTRKGGLKLGGPGALVVYSTYFNFFI